MVSCSGATCTVTLGRNATAQILGTTFVLKDVRDGRAVLQAEDDEVSGAQGETVRAGSLTLRFTAVTRDTVTFTASPA